MLASLFSCVLHDAHSFVLTEVEHHINANTQVLSLSGTGCCLRCKKDQTTFSKLFILPFIIMSSRAFHQSCQPSPTDRDTFPTLSCQLSPLSQTVENELYDVCLVSWRDKPLGSISESRISINSEYVKPEMR